MTAPQATVTNSAGQSATVGIQAGSVHNSTVYQVLPGDPPSRRYEVGVQYLQNGVPGKARELITDAIAHGHDSAEVRFHWMLAMLSKRTYRQLSSEEREQLQLARHETHPDTDTWTAGLHAVYRVLDCLQDPDIDPGDAIKELRALAVSQRAKIVRHLDAFLTGPIRDSLWADTREAAQRGQTRNGRLERVWAYFYPDPIGPRVRPPNPICVGLGDRLLALTATGLFVAAAVYLGWLALAHVSASALVALPLAVVGGYVAARSALGWRYRAERLRTKDREYFGGRRPGRAPRGGFADGVDRLFDHYFAKYVPHGTDRHLWTSTTAGVRNTLRDEVVELYRESRVRDEQVSWLIRYMVADVKQRWQRGTLLDYQEHYRTRAATKAACALGVTLLVLAGIGVIRLAVQAEPLTALVACRCLVLVLLVGRLGDGRSSFSSARWDCCCAFAADEAAGGVDCRRS